MDEITIIAMLAGSLFGQTLAYYFAIRWRKRIPPAELKGADWPQRCAEDWWRRYLMYSFDCQHHVDSLASWIRNRARDAGGQVTVWVVLRMNSPGDWCIRGVFDNGRRARKACRGERYCMSTFVVGEELPEGSAQKQVWQWPKIPLEEEKR